MALIGIGGCGRKGWNGLCFWLVGWDRFVLGGEVVWNDHD